MICSVCGKQITDNKKFCIYCGSPVRKEEKTAQAVKMIRPRFCKSCGSELEEDANFCDQCGAKIELVPDLTDVNIVKVAPKPALSAEKIIKLDPAPPTDSVNIVKVDPAPPTDPVDVIKVKPKPALSADRITELKSTDTSETKEYTEPMLTPVAAAEETEPMLAPVPDTMLREKVDQPAAQQIFSVPGFLALDEFIMDEKITGYVFENAYTIYDMNGNVAGAVQQGKTSAGSKAVRILTGANTKTFEAFLLTLMDPQGKTLATIQRNGGALSDVIIKDGEGRQIVSTKLRFGALKDNATGKTICKLGFGGLTSYKVNDDSGKTLAEIRHKINAKTLFTTADKFQIWISPELTGDKRLIVCAVAVSIDMINGSK